MLEKLNELMGNLEGMFADKDATRKKLASTSCANNACNGAEAGLRNMGWGVKGVGAIGLSANPTWRRWRETEGANPIHVL